MGTDGNDTIEATGSRDVILTLGGDDKVTGLRGEDTVCAGPGNDVVTDVNGYGCASSWGAGTTGSMMFASTAGCSPDQATTRSSCPRGTGSSWTCTSVCDDRLRAVRRADGRADSQSVCLSFEHATHPIEVDLSQGTAHGQGDDRFSGVHCAYGSPQRDHVVGSPASDYIEDFGGPLTVGRRGGRLHQRRRR